MKKRKISAVRILMWVILILFSLWTVFPFCWTVITSFKISGERYTYSFFPFLQFKPTVQNWSLLLTGPERDRTLLGLRSSILVSSISSLLVLIMGSLAGYSLARFSFKRSKDVAVWILSNRMFPPIAVVIPFFLMMKTFHLLDTLPAVIMAHIVYNLPLAIWLMRDFFRELPKEIEEAALIDGCSTIQTFFRVAIPLALPGIIAAYILCFIFSWNEFLFVVTLSYKNVMTLPVVITGALTVVGIDFTRISTLTILAITPPVILAAMTSKYLVRGLTLGAVKE
ncbi:MAG: carbohydrate ABC transporter permease [Atribacterota bacterium]